MNQIIIKYIVSYLLVAAVIQHECGKGPVAISLEVMTNDCNTCTTSYDRLGDNTYQEGITICTLLGCYKTITQNWTDWPECGGHEISPFSTEFPAITLP